MAEQHDQILFMLGKMDGKIDGIIARQDVQNGRLGKHDDMLAGLKAYQDKQSGEIKIWGILGGFVTSLVMMVLGFFLKR